MSIFSKDQKISGKYADIVRKYTSGNVSGQGPEKWNLSDDDGKISQQFLFKAAVDMVYAAGWIGLAEGRRVPLEEVKNVTTKGDVTIFAGQITPRESRFWTLFRCMVLSDDGIGLSIEERVKKISLDPTTKEQGNDDWYYFLTYVYGGLEFIDETFSKVTTYTQLLRFISNLRCEVVGEDD